MRIRTTALLLGALLMGGVSCGDSDDSGGSSASDSGIRSGDRGSGLDLGSDIASDSAATADSGQPPVEFNPAVPGISISMIISLVNMMAQDMGIAAGVVATARREELEPEGGAQIGLDTCVFGVGGHARTCNSNADCAPEQQCVPETDSNGSPIADSEHCETPTETIDVGSFTISGFATGTKTFMYNAGQQGAYTENGQGDGQVQPADIAFDTTYELTGSGNAGHGLGTFTGSVTVPPSFSLTAPSVTTDSMGMAVIPIDPAVGLTLQWNGSGNPNNFLVISISGQSDTLTCRVTDDGELTIRPEYLAPLGMSSMSMMNAVTLETNVVGKISGEGLTVGELTFQQTLMVFGSIP